MAVHIAAMLIKLREEFACICKSHGCRQPYLIRFIQRQIMGLLIGEFLQPVFGISEKYVGSCQLFTHLGGNVIVAGQYL